MDNKYNLYLSDVAKLDIEHNYTVQGHMTFTINVKSQGFYGEHTFCLYKDDICEIVANLDDMIKNLAGECIIKDNESSSFIHLKFINNKELLVKGQMGWDSDDQLLKIGFTADQAMVIALKNNLID